MKQGGFFLTVFGLLGAGLLTIHIWIGHLAAGFIQQPASNTSLQAAWKAHLLAVEDPNQLLQMGTRLAQEGNLDLALITLRQAAQIAPASRDIELALAWCDLRSLQMSKATQPTTTLAEARTALAAARQTDPLAPELAQLSTTLNQLTGKNR